MKSVEKTMTLRIRSVQTDSYLIESTNQIIISTRWKNNQQNDTHRKKLWPIHINLIKYNVMNTTALVRAMICRRIASCAQDKKHRRDYKHPKEKIIHSPRILRELRHLISLQVWYRLIWSKQVLLKNSFLSKRSGSQIVLVNLLINPINRSTWITDQKLKASTKLQDSPLLPKLVWRDNTVVRKRQIIQAHQIPSELIEFISVPRWALESVYNRANLPKTSERLWIHHTSSIISSIPF